MLFPFPASHRSSSRHPQPLRIPPHPSDGSQATPSLPGSGLRPAAGMWWGAQGLRVLGRAGTRRAQPGPARGGREAAANGGLLRHPGRGGSQARGARPENKDSYLFLPSFRRQPLAASPRWIVPAFSLLQLFTGSPWCRHAHKERAIRRGHSRAASTTSPWPAPRGTATPLTRAGRAPTLGSAWAGGDLNPPGTLLCAGWATGLWGELWACRLCPRFNRTSFDGGNVS